MTARPDDSPANILEQIRETARRFRKLISRGEASPIAHFLGQVADEGREDLFAQLLEIEVNFRRSRGETPTSDEYLQRFPQFKRQVRRAFFEPSMASADSVSNADPSDPNSSSENHREDTASLAPTYDLAATNQLGDYELIRKVGQGGMGIVYEARHTKTNNRVALKTLPSGGDRRSINAENLYRFRNEFRRLAEINHPNLVGMQSLEVDGDHWFFTMDLIDGEDFLKFVRPDGQLDEKRLRSCLKQLATGVLELHRRGIIHRDLKPSNVLVSPDGHVTILDFGLAAQLQHSGDMSQTKLGVFAGTAQYAAPEQAFGKRTEASDWYALGTMLFEALTGERPFPDSAPYTLMRSKQEQDPPTLSDRNDVPGDLATLADSLLQRDPELRLTSADLGEVLGLADDTRVPGSTRDSHGSTGSTGSTGSADALHAESEEFEEEEIVLIGRDEQLAQLAAIQREFLETGEPQVVWITGMSGEGKSSLAAKFLRPIREEDQMLVLSGRCYDRESVPFKAIDSIIDPLVRFLRSQDDETLKAWLPPDIEMLAILFPVLRRIRLINDRTPEKIRGLDEEQVRNLAFAAFRDLLRVIGKSTPIVVFVDDLQWGDSDSAEILTQLLAPPTPPAIILLGSFRSDEMQDCAFLRAWADRSRSSDRALTETTVEVAPLSERQCSEFLASRLGDERISDIARINDLLQETRGNPYFLEQLLEGFDSEGSDFQPVSLPQIIQNRLSRCAEDAAGILDVVAIAGKAVPLREIAEVAQLASPAEATITHMRSERLVRLVGSQDEQRVDTYHDKIRETVLASLDDEQRTGLHLRYAQMLDREEASLGSRLFDLAHHYLKANDPRAFDYQLQAGLASYETYAMDAAVTHLRQANELLRGDISPSQRYQLHFYYAKALAACHALVEAELHYRKAADHAGSPLQQASCQYGLGEVQWRRSDFSAAQASFAAGFDEFAERLPRSAAVRVILALWNMAFFFFVPSWFMFRLRRRTRDELAFLTSSHAAMNWITSQIGVTFYLFHVSRAAVISRCTNDMQIRSEAFSAFGGMIAFAGLRWIGRPIVQRASSCASQIPESGGSGLFNLNLFDFYYVNGDPTVAEQYAYRAVEQLSRSGHHQVTHVHHFLWHMWSVRGDCVRLRHHASEEKRLAEKSDEKVPIAWGMYGLAEGLARAGEFQRGLDLADQAEAALIELGSWTVTIARTQKARVQLQAGQYAAAQATSRQAIREYARLRFLEVTAACVALHVEACLTTAWAADPRRISRRSRRRATFYSWVSLVIGWLFPNTLPHAYRVTARLAAAKGNGNRSRKYFGKAIAAAEKIHADYERARALLDRSILQLPGAEEDRESGLALLESLGCVLPEAEAEVLGIDCEAHHARAAEVRERREAELAP